MRTSLSMSVGAIISELIIKSFPDKKWRKAKTSNEGITMKYDLSNMIYYHGEEKCPYSGEMRFFGAGKGCM